MTANSRRYGRWCRDHFATPAQPDPAGAPQPPAGSSQAAESSPVRPEAPEDRKPPRKP
jgi:hypothetical protein